MKGTVILKGYNLTEEKIKEVCGNKTKRVNIKMKDGYGKEYGIRAYLHVNKKGDIRCKMLGLDWFEFKIREKTISIEFICGNLKK